VTSSVYAFLNGLGVAPYAMAKAGVEALGRTLRVELVPHGAGASVAYFGFIDTDMVRIGIDEDELADKFSETLPKLLRKRLTPAQAGEGRRARHRAARAAHHRPAAMGGVQRSARHPQPAARQLHGQGRRGPDHRARARQPRR